jgi:hypothetical protein
VFTVVVMAAAHFMTTSCEPTEDLTLREPTDTLTLSQDVSDVSIRPDSSQGALVYFCTGAQSKSYHADQNCVGLRNCEGHVQPIERKRVGEIGREDPCDICVKDR